MKKIFLFSILAVLGFNALAGDVAVFVDKGFSQDGKTYIFGQYGKTDKDFKGFAEIYAVDVEKNDFIKNNVFTSVATNALDSGLQTFEKLEKKVSYATKKYALEKNTAENLLYLCEEDEKQGEEKIVFKDFSDSTIENPITWKIQLNKTVKGFGVNAKSSFYISVQKENEDGSVLENYKVGTPSVERKGVVDYKIEKIIRNNSKTGLVFVVSKTVQNETGTCIRYMVETVKL